MITRVHLILNESKRNHHEAEVSWLWSRLNGHSEIYLRRELQPEQLSQSQLHHWALLQLQVVRDWWSKISLYVQEVWTHFIWEFTIKSGSRLLGHTVMYRRSRNNYIVPVKVLTGCIFECYWNKCIWIICASSILTNFKAILKEESLHLPCWILTGYIFEWFFVKKSI